jgi:hypothetical protein
MEASKFDSENKPRTIVILPLLGYKTAIKKRQYNETNKCKQGSESYRHSDVCILVDASGIFTVIIRLPITMVLPICCQRNCQAQCEKYWKEPRQAPLVTK